MGDEFDGTTYGRSFADVYDEWYPSDDATDRAIDQLLELLAAGPGGAAGRDVLELGVGTGRLALPLAARGHRVTGLDASVEMLDVLEAKQIGSAGPDSTAPDSTAPDSTAPVTALRCDVATDDWPAGPFDMVLAANNMVFNLTDPDEQAQLFVRAFDVLAPGGVLVVEAFVPAPIDSVDRQLELRSVEPDLVVWIATQTDPATSIVTGQHVELRDGQPVRLRPWQVRVAVPDELDRWAAAAGFELESRWSDWSEGAFGPDSAAHVTLWRRPV